MKYPNLRPERAYSLILLALFVGACAPTQTGKKAFGTPATGAEVARHFSGNSASSASGGAYYAGNGTYRSFYYLSEAPNVCTGTWRVRESKLVVKETCRSVSDGKTVTSAPKTSDYNVYIKPDGAVRLDEQPTEESAGTWDISKPVKGFPRKAEFTAMQKEIESGKTVKPVSALGKVVLGAAGAVVAIPVLVALCGGTLFLLCPM